LEAHNALRKIHESPAMTIDDELQTVAEGVALANAKKGALEHSKNLAKDGENLAYSCDPAGKFQPIKELIKRW